MGGNIKTFAVVGSRKFPEEMYPKVFELLDRFYNKYNPKIFCSGGAKGVDCAAEGWAKTKDMSRLIYRPSLYDNKPGSPLKRNTDIVEASDFILAFSFQNSRGTQDSIEKALQKKKAIIVFDENLKVVKSANIPVDS